MRIIFLTVNKHNNNLYDKWHLANLTPGPSSPKKYLLTKQLIRHGQPASTAVDESLAMESEKFGACIPVDLRESVRKEWRASVFVGGAGKDRRSNLMQWGMNESWEEAKRISRRYEWLGKLRCFFPAEHVCMYVCIYIYISFYVLLTILRCFSFAPSSAAVMCRRSFCTSLQMSPESGPESSSLRRRRGQIVRFLSV